MSIAAAEDNPGKLHETEPSPNDIDEEEEPVRSVNKSGSARGRRHRRFRPPRWVVRSFRCKG